MLGLLVQMLFESRLVPRLAVENAAEITMCCKKAFGDLVELEGELEEDGEEEPAFMDVLVDVLLSLLAQPSAPIRAAAEQVGSGRRLLLTRLRKALRFFSQNSCR